MKKTFIAIALAVMACAGACAATVTLVFAVEPAIADRDCENNIRTNIRFERGVSDVITDRGAGTVTVTFDSVKVSPARLVETFGAIGYKATVITDNTNK